MTTIDYTPYDPRTSSSDLTVGLIQCFRDVFAAQPWNEWLRCAKCDAYWGTKDHVDLIACGFMHCDQPLEDFWSRDTVLSDLYREVTDAERCWLAHIDNRVIGFCWGYPLTARDLSDKVGIDVPSHKASTKEIVYLDEIGLHPSFQGQGLAPELLERFLSTMRDAGYDEIALRTRKGPVASVLYSWLMEKQGFSEIALFPESDGRVILGRNHLNLK